MPLEKFEIVEVSGIKKAICNNVPTLMVIAGPNGVGKSTLLETISRILNGGSMGQSKLTVKGTPKPVYIPPHRSPYPTSLSKHFLTGQPSSSYRDTLRRDSYSVNDPTGSLPPMMRTGLSRSRSYPDIASIFEVKTKLAQIEIKKNETIAAAYEKNKQIPFNSIPNFYDPIRDAIEYLLPGVKFEGVKLENDVYSVYFKNRHGTTIEFDALSSGEKETMAMLFPVIEKQVEDIIALVKGESLPNDDLIILLDSPEAHLHPSLQNVFLKYIRKSIERLGEQGQNLQFIISTHSPVMINESNKDELFLMTYQDQNDNQLIQTSDFDLHQLQSFLGKLGLSALTFGKPLLLLEGIEDEEILRIISPDIETKLVLYNLGGKERVLSFIHALNQIIPELIKRGITVYGIVDKDREEILKSCSDLTQKNLHTLSVTCMENLLLDSQYIFNALSFLSGSKLVGMGMTEPKHIENLKEQLIQQPEFFDQELKIRLNEELSVFVNVDNLKPVNKSNVTKRVDEIVTKRKERIESMIDAQEKNVRDAIAFKNYGQLNGKIIITMIGQKFGLERQILARSIAKMMNQNRFVPPELKQILQEILN